MSDVTPLCAATRNDAPTCCVDCVFWQHRSRTVDAAAKRRWAVDMERNFGPWGRIISDRDRFRGIIHYGPSAAFPRARVMPAGPPSPDAALITCALLAGDDLAGTCEHLVLEALADLKARDIEAVEAFGLRFPDEVAVEDRFEAHHTLFDREFLEGLGFQAHRSAGQVSLMRLPLGGLQTSGSRSLAARLSRPLRSWPTLWPAPATLRQRS